MTDDSSDDRMDRAQRIREMREGSRPDDSLETDASSDDEAVEAGTPDRDRSEGESATAESSTGEADGGDPGPGSPSDDPEDAADWFDEADGTGPGSGVDGAGDGSSDGRVGTNGSVGGGSDGDSSDAGGSDVDEESPFGDGMPQMPGMDIDDASVDADVLAQQAGLETDVEGESPAGGATATGLASSGAGASAETQSAGGGDDAGGAVGMAGSRSGGAVTGATTEDETRVLEFALAEERYCLDIEYVEEIVKRDTVTRVPNTPEYVAGVVDLRGQITTILDPKVIFDIDTEGSEELIVVFDPDGFDDQGAIGWLVDDVNQVMPVADSEVNPSPVDQDHVEGVVDRDGEFVIWTTPERAVENATG